MKHGKIGRLSAGSRIGLNPTWAKVAMKCCLPKQKITASGLLLHATPPKLVLLSSCARKLRPTRFDDSRILTLIPSHWAANATLGCSADLPFRLLQSLAWDHSSIQHGRTWWESTCVSAQLTSKSQPSQNTMLTMRIIDSCRQPSRIKLPRSERIHHSVRCWWIGYG